MNFHSPKCIIFLPLSFLEIRIEFTFDECT